MFKHSCPPQDDLVIPWLFIRLNGKNFQYFGLTGNTCRTNHIPISLSCTTAVLKLKLSLQPKKHFPIDDHCKSKQNDRTRDCYQVLILAGFIFVKLYLKKFSDIFAMLRLWAEHGHYFTYSVTGCRFRKWELSSLSNSHWTGKGAICSFTILSFYTNQWLYSKCKHAVTLN